MKNSKLFFSLILTLTLFLSSCSIYEDIYVNENGSIRYEMKIDGASLMAMLPEDQKPSTSYTTMDSLISIKEIVEEKLSPEELANLTQEQLKDIQNISSFFIRMKNKPDEKICELLLYGDFNNINELNNAFSSFSAFDKLQREGGIMGAPGNPDLKVPNGILNKSTYEWDGKTLSRKAIVEDTDNSLEENDPNIMNFLSKGTLTIKYHFPRKVKSINNPNALLSQDGKTVILEYPASLDKNPSKQIDIEIELE